MTSRHPFPSFFTAQGVSKGIVFGKNWLMLTNPEKNLPTGAQKSRGYEAEATRFREAQAQVVANIGKMIAKARAEIGESEAEIFEAHRMMVQDDELVTPILGDLRENHSCESAVERSFSAQINLFLRADSDYLKERSLDLKDLKNQLLSALGGASGIPRILSPAILIAEELTPSQTMGLDRKNILGIITEKGGKTSHTAIIARTWRIPAITGAPSSIRSLTEKDSIAMDGEEGSVFIIDRPEVENYFQERLHEESRRKTEWEKLRGQASQTLDRHRVKLMANIGSASEAQSALDGDAEGVGLFRTEFLFMERDRAPTLDEQREAYSQVLNRIAPKEVIIRTLDVGGDKHIPYLQISPEENPFLGLRALRYCFKDLPLFKTQIKALLLANERGNLSIMLPMVSRATEAKKAVEIIRECEQELNRPLQPYRIGAMIEIPSIVFEIPELSPHVSFISVGTNDLLQYSVAVDRAHPKLQSLYCAENLGFLRLMKQLADEAIRAGVDLGICGELGGHEQFLPLWIAMGYQKLSMSPGSILARRSQLANYTRAACIELMNQVLKSADENEVRRRLEEFHP